MKIGQVAEQAGVGIDTVRFYERRGVLPEPRRLPSGYRVYSATAVERIKLVRQLRRLGFTLDEVIDALHAHDKGEATCASERWRFGVVLARIDAKIAELHELRREISNVTAACERGDCAFADQA